MADHSRYEIPEWERSSGVKQGGRGAEKGVRATRLSWAQSARGGAMVLCRARFQLTEQRGTRRARDDASFFVSGTEALRNRWLREGACVSTGVHLGSDDDETCPIRPER